MHDENASVSICADMYIYNIQIYLRHPPCTILFSYNQVISGELLGQVYEEKGSPKV